MNYKLENIQGWSSEQIAPYRDFIMQQLGRLALRFSDSLTIDEILNSNREFWLILSEKDEPKAIFTTITDYCKLGRKNLNIMELAGSNSAGFIRLMPQLEQYAKSQGYKNIIIFGRKGWKKLLQAYEFKETSIKYKKEL